MQRKERGGGKHHQDGPDRRGGGEGCVRRCFPALLREAGGGQELRLLLRESFLLNLSCDFHWYCQISQNLGRKGSLTSITAVLSLPALAAARGGHFGDRCV